MSHIGFLLIHFFWGLPSFSCELMFQIIMQKVGKRFAVLLQLSHALHMKSVEQVTVHLKLSKTLHTPKHSFPLEITAISVVMVRMDKVSNIPFYIFYSNGHKKRLRKSQALFYSRQPEPQSTQVSYWCPFFPAQRACFPFWVENWKYLPKYLPDLKLLEVFIYKLLTHTGTQTPMMFQWTKEEKPQTLHFPFCPHIS